MKKTEHCEMLLYNKHVDYYELTKVFSIDDIQQIIEILTDNSVTFQGFRLSNSLEQPDHFFRIFSNFKDLYTCPTEDYYIDDFGIDGIYNNKKFSLSFNIGTNRVHVITKGDISLEPLLLKLESLC